MGRWQRRRQRGSAGEGNGTALADAEEAPPETDPAARTARRGSVETRRTPKFSVRRLKDAWPLLIIQAAHPRQAVATALGVGAVAALAGRPTREVGVVLLTV